MNKRQRKRQFKKKLGPAWRLLCPGTTRVYFKKTKVAQIIDISFTEHGNISLSTPIPAPVSLIPEIIEDACRVIRENFAIDSALIP